MSQGCGESDSGERKALDLLRQCCVELETTSLLSVLDELQERTSEGRFYVACLGQFKRGKSTLLNALIGSRVLPEGVIPVTSALTVLRYGESPAARVRLHGQDWEGVNLEDLRSLVTEEHNPENGKQVEVVEVFLPCPLLAQGLCLVDTPGIGSSLAGNSSVTWSFVPHVDAALVVLGADPPITGEELQLVTDLGKHLRDFVFVLNKVDRTCETDANEAAAFIARTLENRLGRGLIPIHQVSALAQLREREPTRGWEALLDALRRLAEDSGRQLVQAALERGRERVVTALLLEIQQQRQALLAPIEESQARVQRRRDSLAGAEQALRDLGHLLRAEQERLYERLTEQQTEFLQHAIPAARQALERSLRSAPEPRLQLRRRGFDLARDTARTWLDRWLDQEQPQAEQLYREATRRFVQLGKDLVRRLVEPDAGEAATAQLDPELGFRVRSRLYYTELMTLDPGPISWFPDLFRTRESVLRAVVDDGAAYMGQLLETNASRIVGDLNERVLESRRRLEMQIRIALRDAIASAERALDRARAAQGAGEESVATEVRRLGELQQTILASSGAGGKESS